MQLASVSASVEAQEEVLDTLTEQTEACVQKLVETEAQKEFMRYAFLTEPKSLIGKMVSDAWKSFKKWWDEKHRPEVEAEVRGSILGKLNALKKETEESKKDRKDTIRRKGVDR